MNCLMKDENPPDANPLLGAALLFCPLSVCSNCLLRNLFFVCLSARVAVCRKKWSTKCETVQRNFFIEQLLFAVLLIQIVSENEAIPLLHAP